MSDRLRIVVVTLFPEMFRAIMDYGVIGRAAARGDVWIETRNPRDFATGHYRAVDDRPYGGGPGMVMMYRPLTDAIAAARGALGPGARVIAMTPQGRRLDQAAVVRLAGQGPLVIVAGRYEGVDERVLVSQVDEEWSIGDYVLSGGEIAAMVLIDAMVRLLPGVLGHADSAREESFQTGLLDHPHYTRPEVIDGRAVPAVLLTGDHGAIRRWRLKAALGRSWIRRPDLLAERSFGPDEATLLEEYLREHRLIPSPWQGEGEGGG
jgi:tRNA (guanine37-N1)-methyltransferase